MTELIGTATNDPGPALCDTCGGCLDDGHHTLRIKMGGSYWECPKEQEWEAIS